MKPFASLGLGMSLAIGGVLACHHEQQPPTAFDRQFRTVACWSTGTADPVFWRLTPAPCGVYGSPSGTHVLDSSAIAFTSAGVVSWMFAYHRTFCPCYMGTCSDPCTTTASPGEWHTGTYEISGDAIIARFASAPYWYWPDTKTLVLHGAIPRRVHSSWTGPDSLELRRANNLSTSFIYTSP